MESDKPNDPSETDLQQAHAELFKAAQQRLAVIAGQIRGVRGRFGILLDPMDVAGLLGITMIGVLAHENLPREEIKRHIRLLERVIDLEATPPTTN